MGAGKNALASLQDAVLFVSPGTGGLRFASTAGYFLPVLRTEVFQFLFTASRLLCVAKRFVPFFDSLFETSFGGSLLKGVTFPGVAGDAVE